MTVRVVADRVSVIMPAFRAAPFVSDAISSVLSQGHADVEILVADDCSPDNTREVVQELAAIEPRVRLLALSRNGGPARARNAALEEATGRFIAFLDADDLWLPGKLEAQLGVHRSKHVSLSSTRFRRFKSGSGSVGHLLSVPLILRPRRILANTAIATSSVVIDREVAGDFRMTVCPIDDLVTWYRVLQAGGDGVGVQHDLVRYRVMPQSYSRNKPRYAMRVWRAYREDLGMGWPSSALCFAEYAMRGVMKYSRF